MAAWLGVISRDHIRRGVAGGFIQLCHGKAAPLRRMAEGDTLVIYSPRTGMGSGEILQAFTAFGTVGPAELVQVEMAPGFTPFRRSVQWQTVREAPIAPLVPHLSFTRDGQNWGWCLRRGHLPLTQEDAALIRQALGLAET